MCNQTWQVQSKHGLFVKIISAPTAEAAVKQWLVVEVPLPKYTVSDDGFHIIVE